MNRRTYCSTRNARVEIQMVIEKVTENTTQNVIRVMTHSAILGETMITTRIQTTIAINHVIGQELEYE